MQWTSAEFGNAGSRTHTYGQVAKERVTLARTQVAEIVGAAPDEVFFTSGATESNNLALLGLAAFGDQCGRKHIISSQIEHKAVLEPLDELSSRGFEVTLLPPTSGGWIDPDQLQEALRPDTLFVSIMGVNNETGVIQPIDAIGSRLSGHEAFLHVDGAQAFGKTIDLLRDARIDLLSVSGHKIYGPKGIGALIARRRKFTRPPLKPLMFGGGQERGLRPGTLPVALIAGLGLAATLAVQEADMRNSRCRAIQAQALAAFEPLGVAVNGDLGRTVSHTLNVSVPGVDSEAAIVALKDVVALSNGSACTSQSYDPSHVLLAAKIPLDRIAGALRFSWSHLTPEVDWTEIATRLTNLVVRSRA